MRSELLNIVYFIGIWSNLVTSWVAKVKNKNKAEIIEKEKAEILNFDNFLSLFICHLIFKKGTINSF